MTNAHHVLLSNRLRNLARAIRLAEQRAAKGGLDNAAIGLHELNHWATAVETAAQEIDGEPSWQLTNRGRALLDAANEN